MFPFDKLSLSNFSDGHALRLWSPPASLRRMDSLPPSSDGTSWSKLPSDLLHLVFERLGFADFQRAKSVCSSWHYASRQSSPNNQIPWLILFPEKGKDYCLLFNPEEKEKMYRIQDLGDNFANSHCLAICGSWLFMRDPRYNLYIMNLFTRERIDLPSVESQLGIIKIERTIDDMDMFLVKLDDRTYHREHIDIFFSSFWMDEKTKDYVVIWVTECSRMFLVYSRKGDHFWKQVELFLLFDMVYKDHKLYLFYGSRDVTVLDFSGDIPRQIFETHVNYNPFLAKGLALRGDVWDINEDHLVVTVTGEILRVKSKIRSDSDVWSFRIYKLDSSNSGWEKLNSLGDEAMLLDLGITVLANSIEGVDRNSIYFSGIHGNGRCRKWSEKDILVFNLDTHKVERPHRSICSSIQTSDARWFVPNFKWK